LQYGVPLRDLVSKFAHVRFEPSGFTGNAEVPIAKSIVDYIFRWMGSRFLPKDDRDALGILGGAIVSEAPADAAVPGTIDLAAGIADSTAAAPPPAPSTSSGGEGGDRPTASRPAASGALAPMSSARSNVQSGHANGSDAIVAPSGIGPRLAFSVSADSPSCMDCGSIMVRSGSCYKCLNCGATSGCS
jgi:ribonucleoside-diphosphate reductase alpha chain